MPDKKEIRPKRRLSKSPISFREKAEQAQSDEKTSKSRVAPVFNYIKKPFLLINNRIILISKSKRLKLLRKPAKFLVKILLLSYVINSFKELKLVTWPNWKQSRSLTLAVIVFAVIFGAVIAGVDFGLDKIFRKILLK